MIGKIERKKVRQRREFSSEVSKYLKYEPNPSMSVVTYYFIYNLPRIIIRWMESSCTT